MYTHTDVRMYINIFLEILIQLVIKNADVLNLFFIKKFKKIEAKGRKSLIIELFFI